MRTGKSRCTNCSKSIKLQNNEIIDSDNRSSWKVPVGTPCRWIDELTTTSIPTIWFPSSLHNRSPLPFLAPSSCWLRLNCSPLLYILKGSSSVRYLESVRCALSSSFTLAKEVQLSLGLEIYTGIFALYLQCHLKDPRTTVIVFYVLCLLYILSIATTVSDLLSCILPEVSKNSICKIIIIMMQIRIGALETNRLTVNFISQSYCPNRSKRFLWLPRAVYLGTH